MPTNTIFYPPITDIINIDEIPEKLNFLKDDLTQILDKFFYSDLIVEKSPAGDAAFYRITLKIPQRLSVEIPGTNGISLVLNPDFNSDASSIPLTINYEWAILRYLKDFDISKFAGDPLAFLELLLSITGINEEQFLVQLLQIITDTDDPIETFITSYNSIKPDTTIVLPDDLTVNEQIYYITNHLKSNDDSLLTIGYSLFIENDSIEDTLNSIVDFFKGIVDGIDFNDIIQILIPKAKATINNISLALEFPRSILLPLDENDQVIEDENVKSFLVFNVGTLSFSTQKGFEFNTLADFDFTKSQIGKTGLSLAFEDLKLDLSKQNSISEISEAGYTDDFVGAYIGEAEIGLPKGWTKGNGNVKIVGSDLIIGTGGFSGKIGMKRTVPITPGGPVIPPDPLLEINIGGNEGEGGVNIALSSFDITFYQGTITGTNIKGTLTIPGFKKNDDSGDPAVIDIVIGIQNGDFIITAKSLANPLEIKIPDVMSIFIKSLSIGRKSDRYFIGLVGSLDVQLEVPGIGRIIKDPIEAKKLIVWDDGQIEFEGGGAFNLKKPITLNISPVKLSVTAIHLGSYERYHGGKIRKYKYIGFDGGLSINPGGIDAKGSGIKVYFTTDGEDPFDLFIRIQSISIDLLLSGSDPALQLKGFLGQSESGDEYTGGITFKIKKPSLSGSAAMRLNPKIPAFLIDIGLELPTPILLGSTGLGIYQFRALLGQRYVATRKSAGVAEDGSWYDYYKAKIPSTFRVGINVDKFEGKNGFSIGAGVGLSTTVDSGKTLSAKIFFLLTLPEAFLLQGQAAILKGRLGLDDPKDPPFSLFLAVSKDSIQATIGVDYLVPEETGLVLDAHAKFDLAFYFKDKSAWFIHLGTDKEPIRAEIFRIFKLYSFFMLSARGIKLGAGAEYNFQKKLGPFSIKAYAYLKFGAMMNFKPTQVGGFFAIGGGLDIKVLVVRLSMSFTIGLAGEAPKPFIVTGYLEICVRVLRKDRCVKLELTWKKDQSVITTPVIFLNEDGSGNAKSAKAINMLTEEAFGLLAHGNGGSSVPLGTVSYGGFDTITEEPYTIYNGKQVPVVPMDSFISVEFDKAVKAGPALAALIGGEVPSENVESSPPQKGKSDPVLHEYSVEELNIYSWNPAQNRWDPYSIYQALTPILNGGPNGVFSTDVSRLQVGYWQVDDPKKTNKLTIMARTPVNYLRYGTPPPLEDLGVMVDRLLCPGKQLVKVCVNFLDIDINARITQDNLLGRPYGVKVNLRNKDGKIQFIPNVFSKNRSLFVESGGSIEVLYPAPTSQVFLKLGAIAQDVVVSYYRRTSDAADGYTRVRQDTYNQGQLVTEVFYENHQYPIDRVVVEPGTCLPSSGLSCGTAMPTATSLQGVLNTMITNHVLTTGDPRGGQGLTIDRSIPLEYIPTMPGYYFMPSGYAGCSLHLELVRQTELKRYTFTNTKPRNPIGSNRTVRFRIYNRENVQVKNLLCTLPAFNIINPTNDKVIVTTAIRNFLTANAPELSITPVNSTSFIITGNASVGNVVMEINSSIKATLVQNTGAAFNYNNITSVSNIRPDTSQQKEGLNYNFLITAQLSTGGQAELKGYTSCFPIVCCSGATATYLNSTCTAITQQLTLLQNQLAEINQQIQTNQVLCTVLTSSDGCVNEGQRYCYEVTRLETIRTQIQLQITQLIQYQTFYCGSGAVCNGMAPVYPCGVFLHETCFLTWQDFNYNVNIPDFSSLQNSTNAMVEAIEKPLQPLWRPDTVFSIILKIKDTVRRSGSIVNTGISNFAYTFQTKGPVGHFHQYRPEYNGLLPKDKDQFKLADLRPYVDYSKSYPNADGTIVNAKPLYTLDPKLLVFFVVDYMYTMYGTYNSYNGLPSIPQIENLLDVVIADPAKTDAILLADDKKTFEADIDPVIPADIQTMIRLLQAQNPCLSIQVAPPKGVHHQTVLPELEPLKMYTAIFSSKYRSKTTTEVLRYNFQTSRYRTFADHVSSYQLKDEKGVFVKNAVFDIVLNNFTAEDFTLASQIVNNTIAGDHPILAQFMHPYDRLIDGVFKLESLAPPVTTEFNIIRDFSLGNPSSDYIIGILIRSPEPFNDPKIPLAKLNGSIKVIKADGSVDPDFNKVIFSKDINRVFITRSDLHVQNKNITFRFDSLQYQSNLNQVSDYVTVSSVDALIDTPSSVTKLVTGDCGMVEAELNQVLHAELVTNVVRADATKYIFQIDGPAGFTATYTRNAADGVLPLAEVAGIDYNRTYTVKVKNLVKDRLSSFGDTCTVDTRKLYFRIKPVQPAYAYINTDVLITVRLEFSNGALLSDFNGQVTLQGTGSTSVPGGGIVNLVNGVGTITIQNSVAQQATLSLLDSGNTLYNVDSTLVLPFIEHATKVLIDPLQQITRPGADLPVTIRATGPANFTDLGYNGNVELLATGSNVYGIINPIHLINGAAVVSVSDMTSEKVTLSLQNSSTGLNTTSTQTGKFVKAGVSYIISAPSTGTAGNDVTVTITAKTGNVTETNFKLNVTLVADNADVGGGVVTIVNGTGTMLVKRNTAGTIHLHLLDSENTGLNVSSTKDITIS